MFPTGPLPRIPPQSLASNQTDKPGRRGLTDKLRPVETSRQTNFLGGGSYIVGRNAHGIAPTTEYRLPDTTATDDASLKARKTRVAARIGGARPDAGAADATTFDARTAHHQILDLFMPLPGAGHTLDAAAADAVRRDVGLLLAELHRTVGQHPGHVRDGVQWSRALLVAQVLAGIVRDDGPDAPRRGEPAERPGTLAGRALAILQGMQQAVPRGEAFAARLHLARCQAPGMDCLDALDGCTAHGTDSAVDRQVRLQARRAQVLAAAEICQQLPGRLQPTSMEQCVQLARWVDKAPSPAEPEAARILRSRPIVTQALLCATELATDPRKEVWSPRHRLSYLLFRGGATTARDEKQLADSLFLINRQLDLAVETGAKRAWHGLQRMVGGSKLAPIANLVKHGTIQSTTRHPEDDLAAKLPALDAFLQRMNDKLVASDPRQRHSMGTVCSAIRLATVNAWKRHIVHKGWQDELPVGRKMRAAIVQAVCAQLDLKPVQVEDHLELKNLHTLTAAKLAELWRVENLPRTPIDAAGTTVEAALKTFQTLHRNGETLTATPTREELRQEAGRIILEHRQTYALNMEDRNTRGGNVSTSLTLAAAAAAGMPAVGVAPGFVASDIHTRALTLGSNVHGPEINTGDRRGVAGSVSVGASVGWMLLEMLNAGLRANFTPLSVDAFGARTGVVRGKAITTGDETNLEAWRALQHAVFLQITDPEVKDADTMMHWLAARFYKNPDISFQAQDQRSLTLGTSADLSATLRLGIPGTGLQVGPGVTVGFGARKVIHQRKDRGIVRETRYSEETSLHGGSLSAALGGTAPTGLVDGSATPGEVSRVGGPAASFAGRSYSFLTNAKSFIVRLATQDGRVDEDYSVRDYQRGSAKSFCRHIDAHRSEWLRALAADNTPEALEDATRRLDTFLTRIGQEETSGAVTYGARYRLTTQAARQIDHFRAMEEAASPQHREPTPAEKEQIRHWQGEVTRVLADDGSYDPRSLWKLSLNSASTRKGWQLGIDAYHTLSEAFGHQDIVAVAKRAPKREEQAGRYITSSSH